MVVPHPELQGGHGVCPTPRASGSPDRRRPHGQTFGLLFSGMLWIYLATASTTIAGPTDALIGLASSVVCFFVVYRATTRHGGEWSRTLSPSMARRFDSTGRIVMALVVPVAATAIAVLYGSILARVLSHGLGVGQSTSSVLVVVAAAALQSKRRRIVPHLDRYLNGTYAVGLVVIVICATIRRQGNADWQSSTAAVQYLPGWLFSSLVFIGGWVMLGYVLRHRRDQDVIGSSPLPTRPIEAVYYATTGSLIGVIGIVLACQGRSGSTIAATVLSVVTSLGGCGVVLLILVLLRMSEPHYALAIAGWQELVGRLSGRRVSRSGGITITCAVVYLSLREEWSCPALTILCGVGALIVAWAVVALWMPMTSRKHLRRTDTGMN